MTKDRKTKPIPDRILSDFCGELGMLLSGGCPADEALFLMSKTRRPFPWAKPLAEASAVGEPLHIAMAELPALPEYIKALVETGEKAGRLPEALTGLASWYDAQDKLKAQARAAVLRSLGTLILILTVMGVLVMEILPVFDGVYASLGAGLSGPAAFLLSAGRALRKILPGAAAAALLAALLLSLPPVRRRLKNSVKKVLAKTPWSVAAAQAKTAQTMAMALSSGLNIDDAMSLASRIAEDGESKKKTADCAALLASGQPLAAAVRTTGLLPESECGVLDLAARAGSLDSAMSRCAARLTKNALAGVSSAVDKIEPAIVLLGAALSGIMLLIVMLPMLDILAALGV